MSVIQKIRTRYAKLAGGVIAFALIAFILTDFLTGNNGGIFGPDDSVVKVNGNKVNYIEYNKRVQSYEVLYSASRQLDENMRAQLREQALQDLINESLIKEEAEKIGLTVTEKEKEEMIYGQDPDQSVQTYQAFTNPNTNRFDPQYVKLFEEQVDQLDPSGKAKAHWEEMKSYIVFNSLPKKYNMLFTNSMYMPKFMIEARMNREEEMANIDFVNVSYEEIKDEEVKLTDDDYKKFINNHKDEYTVKTPSRSIEYVPFNIVPAQVDTARALTFLKTIKEDFEKADDDESFVNRNSDVSYQESYVKKDTYFSAYADSIFSLKKGEVFGPYFEQGNYKLVKLEDVQQYPDSVKCRHILVKTANGNQQIIPDSLAKLRIDSAVAAIKSGATFAEMVQRYSDDEGSKNTAGEYTFSFQQKPNLSKEFADFIFEGKTGEKKIVKVENGSYAGYHYIEILNQPGVSNAYRFATVTKSLYAGEETESNIYAQASEFAANNSTPEAFDSAASNGTVQRRFAEAIKINDFSIQGLGPSREIISWIYESEVGDVSQVFSLNGKYVVVKVTGAKKEGLMPLDETLKSNIESDVKRKKKAEIILDRYKDKSSLTDIAQASGQEIKHQDSFRANNSFAGELGYAPKTVGYTFAPTTKMNAMSQGLEEQAGIYYVLPKAVYKDEYRNTDSTLISREQVMMESQIKNSISSLLSEQLKQDADIKYNPKNF